ncbi:unnamed protein product [Rotaria sp. Silwood2]|nr:unnamed protein product [Rotaria sp. Silwood2]
MIGAKFSTNPPSFIEFEDDRCKSRRKLAELPSFIAARARYFRILDELRADNAIIFDQDDTGSNADDEKRSIWIAEGGSGRSKACDTKGEIEKMIIYLHTILLNQSFPGKRLVDEAAQRFNVEILRLPVRHSVLNPIELAWAGLKNYIRDNNTNFRLVDVHNLTMEYLAAVDGPLSTSYFQHIKTYEDSFKAADKYVQEVVDPTLDENDDETFDNDSNDDESVIDSDDLDDDDSSDT